MFLKRDPKNRSIISRFLAAFIRPFMSERPCQLPQLFFHSQDGPRHIQEPVVQWNTHMSQYLDADGDNTYARCFLHHIEYHKCSDRVGHELLVFHFTHWDTSFSAVGVVCVDRTINQENTSARQSGLICPSLSDDTVAHDTASIVGSPHDAEAYIKEKYGASNVLCTMQFPSSSRPSTLQVSTILALVNEHSIFYTLYQHQCYWYADTVWRSLKRLFLGNEHLGEDHNSRAHFAGFQLGPSDESINVVCERYELAWAQTLEQLSQARNLREAQIARIREEGRAACEPVIRAQQRQIEEDQRLHSEQRRQIEELRSEQRRREWEQECREREQERREQELQAEIDRLRAQAVATAHDTL